MVLRKSQRAVSLVLSLVMLLALSAVFCFDRAYAAADGEWTYELEGSGAVITSYIGTGKSVTVPSTIAGQKVYKVNALSTNNFKSNITSVTFSEGISVLGESVCKGYTSLERVSLPSTLTTIGTDAFLGCISLTGITVPASVVSIGDSAFAGCTSLSSASLVCHADVIPIKLFSGDKSLTTLTLPAYITEIGANAFNECSSLQSVSIPNTVKTIGKNAFSNCTRLSSVSLPASLKLLDDLAFYNCTSLQTIFIPGKTRTIGNEVFSGCTSLTSAYISPSVNVLNNAVFNGCKNLDKLVFGGDYFQFSELSSISIGVTVYYPVKYASSWAAYSGTKAKSYQAPSSVSISDAKNIAPGDEINLKITIAPAAGEFNDVYVLSSSNPTVATVSPSGKVIARATGTTTITLTTLNGLTSSVDISVTPDAPTNVSVSAKSTTSAVISWKGGKNVTGYNVYRSTTKNGKFSKVGTASTESYTDKGLTKGKTYFYKVASYVNNGAAQVLSGYSSTVSITACAPAPSTVSAKKAKSGAAKITWAKSTGCSGYEVYYATSSKGKYTKATDISKASTVTYTKSGLKSGKTYYFKVRSYTTVNGKKIYSDYTKPVKVKV